MQSSTPLQSLIQLSISDSSLLNLLHSACFVLPQMDNMHNCELLSLFLIVDSTANLTVVQLGRHLKTCDTEDHTTDTLRFSTSACSC